MAEYDGHDLLSSLSSEVLSIILTYLPAKSLLNLSETCHRLRNMCVNCDILWKRLCKADFDANLVVKGAFQSYYFLYQLLCKSRVILEDTDYCTYSGYLPDWLYYWSALSSKPPLPGFFSLPAGRTKKTWGLTDEDLTAYQVKCNHVRAVRLERYYSWADGFETALSKHGSIQKFQEIALKRCMRSQKLIHKNYPKAASSRRKRIFNKFQNENNSTVIVKQVLTRCKEGADPYLRYHEPQKIGQDFIDGTVEYSYVLGPGCSKLGRLHKSGLKQLQAYVEFTKRLLQETNIEVSTDVPDCVLHVYEKLASVVYKRLVHTDEFFYSSRDYMGRVDQVWAWQSEKGMEHRLMFRDSSKIKAHASYSIYLEKGNESDFRILRLYFEGSENLKLWLGENQWIMKLVDSNITSVLEGQGQSPCKLLEVREVKRMVKQYLKSGRQVHFYKILKHLCDLSKGFLNQHLAHVKELEESISP